MRVWRFQWHDTYRTAADFYFTSGRRPAPTFAYVEGYCLSFLFLNHYNVDDTIVNRPHVDVKALLRFETEGKASDWVAAVKDRLQTGSLAHVSPEAVYITTRLFFDEGATVGDLRQTLHQLGLEMKRLGAPPYYR